MVQRTGTNCSPHTRKTIGGNFMKGRLILLFFWMTIIHAQTIWKDQIIFKTLQYQPKANDRSYVLLYAQEDRKLITLDAETGERLETQFLLGDEDIFLPVSKDKFLQRSVLFIGQKTKTNWEISIYHFTSKALQPTGPALVLPVECQRILEIVYQNGYLYYLYEEEGKLILERKNIQCTNVGLPTFSNESSELFYDSQIDDFLVERKFAVLPDGLDTSDDLVILITKGTRAPEKITARNCKCETVGVHCIKELPDKSISFTPPAGTNFPTILIQGSIQNEYKLYLIGYKNEQTYIYKRSKMGNEEEEDIELDTIPVSGGILYAPPFQLVGNWWFPLQKQNGVDMFNYYELDGVQKYASNYIETYPLYLLGDKNDEHFIYGFSPSAWKKYALGRSLSDWEEYGGFRTLETDKKSKKSLCSLPNKSAVQGKIIGTPYSYGLPPIETLEIPETNNFYSEYVYLNTKESSPTFAVTRKYCLQYNKYYNPRRRTQEEQQYEYNLIWEASYGFDQELQGFYLPYHGKNTLLVHAVNQLHQISCQLEKDETRIQTFQFNNILIPDGIESKEWYKNDLKHIVQMESLGQWNEQNYYIIRTKNNIYQALIDSQDICTLIPATNVTGPIQEISYCQLSEDGTTLICGGINFLQRAFFATLDLIAGKGMPHFTGATFTYVQDMKEQYNRKPQKILQRGDQYFLLTKTNDLEIYEKTNGKFLYAGNLTLPDSKIKDTEILDSILWIVGNNKLYSLDLRNITMGYSVQNHFQQNKTEWDIAFPEEPTCLTKNHNTIFLHFPQQLHAFNGSPELGIHHRTLINTEKKINLGFQIQTSNTSYYITAHKQLYTVNKNNLTQHGSLPIWKTVHPDICQLFLSQDNKELYYLSQDGEVGAIQTNE